MLSTELELSIVRKDDKITDLIIKPKVGASDRARDFCTSFYYRFFREEALLYFINQKMYLRHFGYKFNEMPRFELCPTDFRDLEAGKQNGWTMVNSNSRRIEHLSIIHMRPKEPYRSFKYRHF